MTLQGVSSRTSHLLVEDIPVAAEVTAEKEVASVNSCGSSNMNA